MGWALFVFGLGAVSLGGLVVFNAAVSRERDSTPYAAGIGVMIVGGFLAARPYLQSVGAFR